MRQFKSWGRHAFLLATSLCLIFTAMPTAMAAKRPTTSQQMQAQLKQLMKDNQANAIILVNGPHRDRPIVIRNRVTVNHKKAAAVSPHKLFPIASFQKSITGLAIYQLSQRHRLSTRNTLAKYYPQIKKADRVTIQNLMTHTSGYADATRIAPHTMQRQHQMQRYTLKNYQVISASGPWHYANVNYGLLALIVSKVSHESYHHYLRRQIFQRYGMKSAVFLNQLHSYRHVTRSINVSYSNDPKAKGHPRQYLNREMAAEYGAGDMFCTPLDYWHFINRAILTNPRLIMNYQRQEERVAKPYYYGGFYLRRGQLHTNSSCDGYSATMYCDYRSRRTVMIFSNNLNHAQMRRLAAQLHDIYFKNEGNFAY